MSDKEIIKLKPGRRPRHSGYTFLRTNELPEGSEHIEKYLTWVRESYIEELGPREEDLSTGQTVLLNDLIVCIGFCRLFEERARVEKKPLLLRQEHYLRFKRHIRALCLDLGIEKRKADRDFDLPAYIKQVDEAKAAERKGEEE